VNNVRRWAPPIFIFGKPPVAAAEAHMFKKTSQVSRETGIPHYKLHYLIRRGLITLSKDCSGDLLWSPDDIKAALAATSKADRRFKQHKGAVCA
jgi:hypothetical protein